MSVATNRSGTRSGMNEGAAGERANAILSFDKAQLDRARGIARASVRRLNIKDEAAVIPLETLLGVYELVYRETNSHDAALFVSASEAKAIIVERPLRINIEYPQSHHEITRGIDCTPKAIAGYCKSVATQAKGRLQKNLLPQAIIIESRSYEFSQPQTTSKSSFLIGLDEERNYLEGNIKRLFMYDPSTRKNADEETFLSSILYVGPPGTGKSTLINEARIKGEELERMTRMPFTFETFDAGDFSSYFGRTTKILKHKLNKISDPKGVGMICIDDVDMIMEGRESSNGGASSLKEMQQYLLQFMSGVKGNNCNAFIFMASNKPQILDGALQSRAGEVRYIDPFVDKDNHARFFEAYIPTLSASEASALASESFSAGLRGRELNNIVKQAYRRVNPPPTDEELYARRRLTEVGSPSAELVSSLIVERITALHKQA